MLVENFGKTLQSFLPDCLFAGPPRPGEGQGCGAFHLHIGHHILHYLPVMPDAG
jgi:hypothetical protein